MYLCISIQPSSNLFYPKLLKKANLFRSTPPRPLPPKFDKNTILCYVLLYIVLFIKPKQRKRKGGALWRTRTSGSRFRQHIQPPGKPAILRRSGSSPKESRRSTATRCSSACRAPSARKTVSSSTSATTRSGRKSYGRSIWRPPGATPATRAAFGTSTGATAGGTGAGASSTTGGMTTISSCVASRRRDAWNRGIIPPKAD